MITTLPHPVEFVEVMEHGYHPTGPLSFLTSIVECDDIPRYVDGCLDDLGLRVRAIGWGEEGLVLDFNNRHDLFLFSLGFKGPRMG
jgi:hypothetical protein